MPAGSYAQSDLADIAKTLKDSYKMRTWTDLTSDYRFFVAMRMMKEHSEIDSGNSLIWEYMIDTQPNARSVPLVSTDVVSNRDVMTTASVGWRHQETSWWLSRRIINMYSDNDLKIIDYGLKQRISAWVGLLKLIEDTWWGALNATDDGVTPFGLRYWIAKDFTGNADGTGEGDWTGSTVFSGTYPGGLNNTRARNFCNKYTNFSESDVVTKLMYAINKCKFMPATPMPQSRGKHRYGLYTTLEAKISLWKLARAANDAVGFDLGNGFAQMAFLNLPLEDVPALEYDTENPIYGVDWGSLRVAFLKGEQFTETRRDAPSQHTVHNEFVDVTWNSKCYDRRAQFVLAQGSTY